MSKGRIKRTRNYKRRVPVARPERYCIVAAANDRRMDFRGYPSSQDEPDGCLVLYIIQWWYENGDADIALAVRDDDGTELDRVYPEGTPFDYLVRVVNNVAMLDEGIMATLGLRRFGDL